MRIIGCHYVEGEGEGDKEEGTVLVEGKNEVVFLPCIGRGG